MAAPNSSTSTASAFSGASLRRREPLAAAAKVEQPFLFEMKEDARLASEYTSAERYTEPTLFAFMEQGH
jgi:hypothetical protein